MKDKLKIITVLFAIVILSVFIYVIKSPQREYLFDSKNPTYDSKDLSVQYHSDPINTTHDEYVFQDASFNDQIYIPKSYYTSGAFPYGPATWEPSYADSVYLSKTTNEYTMLPVISTQLLQRGFCAEKDTDKEKVEQICKQLGTDVCSSTSCCVLLGGTNCVSGDRGGPTYKANYSDPYLQRKDFYYYQGKCYGNCP